MKYITIFLLLSILSGCSNIWISKKGSSTLDSQIEYSDNSEEGAGVSLSGKTGLSDDDDEQ
jgi:uncharacterized protein YceK